MEKRKSNRKLVNYMEELAAQELEHLLKRSPYVCGCPDCREDIMAIALNHLPAKYSRTEAGAVYLKLQGLDGQIRADIAAELEKAIEKVKRNPRHHD
ncbi:MAG: late competence development ComFB family protein [Elusimicrobiaceae bacterium]|jgi:competence protein ComFB